MVISMRCIRLPQYFQALPIGYQTIHHAHLYRAPDKLMVSNCNEKFCGPEILIFIILYVLETYDFLFVAIYFFFSFFTREF